jgi:hypothetical protein
MEKVSCAAAFQILVIQGILIRDSPGTLHEVDALIEDIF